MTTRPTSIKLHESDLAAVDAAASKAGVSRSAWIVETIRSALGVTTTRLPDDYQNDYPATTARLPDDYLLTTANLTERIEAIEKQLASLVASPRPRTPKPARVKPASDKAPVTVSGAGRYDETEVLAIIENMRLEQTATGLKPNNKAIADALNAAGWTQSNGNAWNNDRINTVITRQLPHLKG